MKTPRFNVFNQIHKALRAWMFETALIMQQTDFTNPDNAAPVLEQTEMLLDIMDSHAHYEDTYILSAVEKYAPEVIAEFEQEHETDLQLTEQLRSKLAGYRAAASNEERYELGYDILYALKDFIAFNLKHMNKEETLLHQILWANFTDVEIIQMETTIQQQIAPEKVSIYFKWMIKGINDPELVHWLKIVKNDAPDFVFAGLLQSCQQYLAADRWAFISGQIAEGEMIS